MKNCKWVLSVLALVGFLSPRAANAAALVFDDTVGGQITVFANDFEFGSTLNGNPFQSGLSNPAQETIPGEGPVTFHGQWLDLGASTPTTRTIYIVEAGNPSLVSDIFSYSVTTDGSVGTFDATFTSSATEGGLGALPGGVDPADVYVESNAPIPFAAAYLGGEIRVVPEPGTCLLMLLGACGLVARKR